eukprot:g779.t1
MAADRQIKLHPLVLINISDHHTRVRLRPEDSPLHSHESRAVGVLFGVQRGNAVDIHESFEMIYQRDDAAGVLRFDAEFLERKKAQCEFDLSATEMPGYHGA